MAKNAVIAPTSQISSSVRPAARAAFSSRSPKCSGVRVSPRARSTIARQRSGSSVSQGLIAT